MSDYHKKSEQELHAIADASHQEHKSVTGQGPRGQMKKDIDRVNNEAYAATIKADGDPIRAKEYMSGTTAPYTDRAVLDEESSSAARLDARIKKNK